MSLREAAQQALEALEVADSWGTWYRGSKAITDLRAALASPTSQESRQVEPVAWMVYTLDGQSAFITDNPSDFTPEHRALPLYTAPPQRKPLTESFLDELAEKHVTNCYFDTLTYARAIERAHGIGGEE